MKTLSPIILFVYNRPWHTQQALDALMSNQLADESLLYIYADGPKENDKKEEAKIADVRKVIRSKKWCKEVRIIESAHNQGLADSIIKGVTQMVNEYGKIIVLEDDIVTSKGFLKYMNNALDLYENEARVFGISAYMFPLPEFNEADTFFYKANSCWGWGTWARAWKYFNNDALDLYKQLIDKKINWESFNAFQADAFKNQLIRNVEKTMNTWAVKWHAALYLHDALVLHPKRSLVQNIGFDGSGINCSNVTSPQSHLLAESVRVERIPVAENPTANEYLKNYFLNLSIPKPDNFSHRALYKNRVRHQFSSFKKIFKSTKKRPFPYFDLISQKEFERLKNLPRFVKTATSLSGHKIEIADSTTFLSSLQEIFIEEIYKFNPGTTNEIDIIDCGGNIGLASIYLKRKFPAARITSFEADPNIFMAMKNNFLSFGFSDIEAINAAVSDHHGKVNFQLEGGHSGMISNDSSSANTARVSSVRLKTFLQKYQHITFLKIDIEGHETKVVPDIKEELKKVEFLFVEYHSFINQEQQLDVILKQIGDAGFRYYIKEAYNKRDPFINREIFLEMDLLVNIFCYRD